jgi:hypothetical protein
LVPGFKPVQNFTESLLQQKPTPFENYMADVIGNLVMPWQQFMLESDS